MADRSAFSEHIVSRNVSLVWFCACKSKLANVAFRGELAPSGFELSLLPCLLWLCLEAKVALCESPCWLWILRDQVGAVHPGALWRSSFRGLCLENHEKFVLRSQCSVFEVSRL